MTIRVTFAVLVVFCVAVSAAPADAAEARTATVKAAPARAVVPGASAQNKRLAPAPGSTRYKCTTENKHTECVCKGMLDCSALIKSGDCKGGTPWEDPDDPSVGGCG